MTIPMIHKQSRTTKMKKSCNNGTSKSSNTCSYKWKKSRKEILATHRILQKEWLDLDDQAYQIVQALVGIRTRLPMHARFLKLFQQDRRQTWCRCDTNNDADVYGECWENHGFHHNFHNKNTKANACLSGEDVQNALSHNMIQHEKC